jgi:hypothetical protein
MKKTNSTPFDLAKLVFGKLKGAKISYPQLSEDILNKLFESLFFTSLKTEEGQFIKLTITLIDSENPDPSPPLRIVADRWNYIYFDKRIPCDVKNLIKLSKAADPWSSSLAIYYDNNNELYIWGMIDQAVHYQSFLNYEVDEGPEQPGLFQTSITGIGSLIVIFDYELIATLKQNILISNYIDVFRLGPVSNILSQNAKTIKAKIKSYLKKDFPDNDPDEWIDYTQHTVNETLSRILLRIQNYQHGGAILITNNIRVDLDIKYKITYDRLNESIVNLVKLAIEYFNYSNDINDKYLENDKKMLPVDAYLKESVSEFEKEETSNELKGAIRFVSSLSCVDGLVVLSPNMKVKGFGAVIKLIEIPYYIYISKTSIIRDSKLFSISTNHFGTRHRSVFSYCWNHSDCLGFVVSQDGDIRAILRINDKLIIWENIKVQQFIRSNKLKRLVKKIQINN